MRNPIDAFVLARLEAAGLDLSPEADRGTLIRRATFDLWGLPPTREEVDAFLADPAPDAYERLVDRLLESPRYGERLGEALARPGGVCRLGGDPLRRLRPHGLVALSRLGDPGVQRRHAL